MRSTYKDVDIEKLKINLLGNAVGKGNMYIFKFYHDVKIDHSRSSYLEELIVSWEEKELWLLVLIA